MASRKRAVRGVYDGFLCSLRGRTSRPADMRVDPHGKSAPIMEVMHLAKTAPWLSIKTTQLDPFASSLRFPGNTQFRLWLLKNTSLHLEAVLPALLGLRKVHRSFLFLTNWACLSSSGGPPLYTPPKSRSGVRRGGDYTRHVAQPTSQVTKVLNSAVGRWFVFPISVFRGPVLKLSHRSSLVV